MTESHFLHRHCQPFAVDNGHQAIINALHGNAIALYVKVQQAPPCTKCWKEPLWTYGLSAASRSTCIKML
jgi:hypothetical protein